jgi:hypothetical protein
MLRRNALSSVAAVGAVLGAALAGCASAQAQPPATLPATVAAGAAPSSGSASPLPSPPGISASIPSDLTIDFEQPPTADPNLLVVTADAKQLIYAFEQALARGSTTDPLVRSLVTQQADLQMTQLLTQLTQKKTRPSGTVRFFRVTPTHTGDFYGVGFCEDDSKAAPVSVKNGSSRGSAPTGDSALRQWDVGFAAASGGKLQIDYLLTRVGSSACD